MNVCFPQANRGLYDGRPTITLVSVSGSWTVQMEQ